MIRTGVVAVIIQLCLLAAVLSCQSSSRALAVIEQNKCRECHTLKGKGGSSAPNLTSVGARRDRVYIYEQIRSPRSHNPNSDMPSFEGRISAEDINILADYLSGLK